MSRQEKKQDKLLPRQEWRINQRQINNEDERKQQFDELPRNQRWKTDEDELPRNQRGKTNQNELPSKQGWGNNKELERNNRLIEDEHEKIRIEQLNKLPVFRYQSDWTPKNIEIIRNAINDGIIKTSDELRQKIGNHSKKKIIKKNGVIIYTPASLMLDVKIGDDGKKKANIGEHEFYKQFTRILKTIETKDDKNGYINFVPTEQAQIYALNRSGVFWRKKIYDYMMGKILYEHAMDEMYNMYEMYERREMYQMYQIDNIFNEELIEQIKTMIMLRNQENDLFDQLKIKQNLTHDDAHIKDDAHTKDDHIKADHIKAEKREINNLNQVQTYLRYKDDDSFNELINEAKFYKKYLKYKNKYLTLKKLVEK